MSGQLHELLDIQIAYQQGEREDGVPVWDWAPAIEELRRLLAIEEAAQEIAKRPCRIFDYSSCLEAGVEPKCEPCIARAALGEPDKAGRG